MKWLERRKGEEKSTSASKQTGFNSLMHTGSFATSLLALVGLFSYCQAYGRKDYRHWEWRGWLSQCRTRYSQEVTSDPLRGSESCLPEGLSVAAGSGYDYLSLPRWSLKSNLKALKCVKKPSSRKFIVHSWLVLQEWKPFLDNIHSYNELKCSICL